jgi:hypothetical protein
MDESDTTVGIYKDKQPDQLLKELDMLNRRSMFLSRLRVDVGRFYIAIAVAVGGGVAGARFLDPTLVVPMIGVLSVPFMLLGFAILYFDALMRARTIAVGREIRYRISDLGHKVSDRREILNEDAGFAVTITCVNAVVVLLLVAVFRVESPGGISNWAAQSIGYPVLASSVVSLQLVVWLIVSKWQSKRMDGWTG